MKHNHDELTRIQNQRASMLPDDEATQCVWQYARSVAERYAEFMALKPEQSATRMTTAETVKSKEATA